MPSSIGMQMNGFVNTDSNVYQLVFGSIKRRTTMYTTYSPHITSRSLKKYAIITHIPELRHTKLARHHSPEIATSLSLLPSLPLFVHTPSMKTIEHRIFNLSCLNRFAIIDASNQVCDNGLIVIV